MHRVPERITQAARGGSLAVLVVGGVLAACLPATIPGSLDASPSLALPGSTPIALPSPHLVGTVTLEEALAARRSVREFAPGDLAPDEIGQLLWAAQGVTSATGGRTAPSAGALYPLELFVTGPGGTFRYLPASHALEPVSARDLRPDLAVAALQGTVGEGAVTVVIVGVPARSAAKYGSRAERYVQLEAGHAAQNLLLQAVALDLGAVPVGAFDDASVREILDLPDSWQPLYLVPVGRHG
jgi:SagB-type dehydrogenase family enzyme